MDTTLVPYHYRRLYTIPPREPTVAIRQPQAGIGYGYHHKIPWAR